jgi:hypothetical protein
MFYPRAGTVEDESPGHASSTAPIVLGFSPEPPDNRDNVCRYMDNPEWTDLSADAALASHLLVGWVFWDPGAIAGHAALGIPNGAGYYIASRGAPLAPSGDDAVAAAFFSIHTGFVKASLQLVRQHTSFEAVAENRNGAVARGLAELAPEVAALIASMRDDLWRVADDLDPSGKVLFAAHRGMPRPADPVTSAWLAINCIREWRGDVHWAIVLSHGLGAVEAGLLHDAWMGYPGQWIPRSRGASDAAITRALERLHALGLASDGQVDHRGVALRDEIERQTDRLTTAPWELLGAARTTSFADAVLDRRATLIGRIDATAGPHWMPAARAPGSARRSSPG